jgi:cytochrome oxidase assembly protein ShyY1
MLGIKVIGFRVVFTLGKWQVSILKKEVRGERRRDC